MDAKRKRELVKDLLTSGRKESIWKDVIKICSGTKAQSVLWFFRLPKQNSSSKFAGTTLLDY